MKTALMILLFFFVSSHAHARFATALLFEPYVQGMQGKASIKNSNTEYKYSGWAGGARTGLAFSHVQFFGEAQYGGLLVNNSKLSLSEQFNTPFSKPTFFQYGAGAALNIWYFQLLYTYFFESNLTAGISNFSEKYTYKGQTHQYALKVLLLHGWSLGLGYSKSEYKNYSLNQNLSQGSDQLLKAAKGERQTLTTENYQLQISYQFLF